MEEHSTYLYETHLHTAPVSRCGRAGVRETLEFYKSLSYAGVFITNHFLDGNINIDRSLPYEERIAFYFSDYEAGVALGKEIGISVFCGVEMAYMDTHFLIYGLGKAWFLSHPEMDTIRKKEQFRVLSEAGALIVQAHPFREANFIECIRLFPREVHAVESYNASRTDFENRMAEEYARNYAITPFAGSDNHSAAAQKRLGGMAATSPLLDEQDFICRVKNGEMTPFCKLLP